MQQRREGKYDRAVSPRPRLTDSEQAALLDATVTVIAERGVEATRLTDVARAAGCSTGTLQHYFGSREGLLAAAFGRLNSVSEAQARSLAARIADPWERLLALFSFMLGDAAGAVEWVVWVEFWHACLRDERLRARSAAVYEAWREPIKGAIEQGRAEGRFAPHADDETIVATLLAAIDGVALHALLGLGELTLDNGTAALARIAAGELGFVESDLRA
jgi:AcrR family transcriptional regulator